MVTAGGGSVDKSGHQPVAPILEVAGPFIGFVCQHHVLQHQGELLELFCRQGGQAALELVAEHKADDVAHRCRAPVVVTMECRHQFRKKGVRKPSIMPEGRVPAITN